MYTFRTRQLSTPSDGANQAFWPASVAVVIAMLLTVVLYLPGLSGTYFFDDYPNIVENMRLHVDSLDWRQWLQAVWSSPSSGMQRPLASLTFALNFFFGGLNPWPMKAVNLAIHLLNGGLLYLLMLRIGRLTISEEDSQTRIRWLAILVSAAWLLHPINITTVLYVVQRMEELAQTFVLAGLCLYVDARTGQCTQKTGVQWRLWVGVPSLTLVGLLAKETAALLPLLALAIELVLPPRKESTQSRRNVYAFFAIFLALPLTIGLTWLLPHVLSPDAYGSRTFTLTQRLLTEPRVLLDYACWILIPLPNFFSFYHDAIVISTTWLEPWTTLPSALALAFALAAGIMLRHKRPMAALGLLWFLAAHSLTATVIPLEIAFEHRNYFASIGLILTAFDSLLPRDSKSTTFIARLGGLCAFLTLCCFSTLLRSREWSNPISLAQIETIHNPQSARAAYEYARTLVVLSDYRTDSPLVPKAFDALIRASQIPDSGILSDVGLVMLASHTGRPVETQWWSSIRKKLEQRPPSAGDDEALKNLTLCQREGRCVIDDGEMLQIYLAAVNHKRATPASLYSYALFAYGRLHDADLALRLVRDAADNSTGDLQYRLNLLDFLVSLRMYDAATVQLELIKSQDRRGAFIFEIDKRTRELRNVR